LKELGLAGSAAGAANAFWQIASTIVPTVVGGVFAASGSFFWAFATLAAGPLLGMVCMLGVREQPASPVTDPVTAEVGSR
jgi:MFS transporter, ACS family, glucarate transporter